jgi:hypothetical protein
MDGKRTIGFTDKFARTFGSGNSISSFKIPASLRHEMGSYVCDLTIGAERGFISEPLKTSTVLAHYLSSQAMISIRNFTTIWQPFLAILSVSRPSKTARSSRIYQVARRDNARKRHVSKFGRLLRIHAYSYIVESPGHR